MDVSSNISIVFAIITYILIVLVTSIKIRRTHLSNYELSRLIEDGDESARETKNRETLMVHVLAIKRITYIILAALYVLIVSASLHWALGAIIAMVSLLFVETLAHNAQIARFSSRLYEKYERYVLIAAEKCAPFLSAFNRSDELPIDFHLNSQEELVHLIDESGHVLDQRQRQLLRNTLTFDDKLIEEVMTPRTVIESVDKDEPLGPIVLDTLHKTGHSRFPVVDKDIDHVVGILYLRDLVGKTVKAKKIEQAMEPKVYYIRYDQSLEHALAAFLRTYHHLFIVVNEYRETVGIVSLEDVIESLIGHEIRDEFDQHSDLRAVAKRNPRKNNQPERKENV